MHFGNYSKYYQGNNSFQIWYGSDYRGKDGSCDVEDWQEVALEVTNLFIQSAITSNFRV